MGNYTFWTDEMNQFLARNYRWIGDTDLASMFEIKFPKNHPWTKKHIEKRRFYLKLKRTKEQEHFLRCLNNSDGRHYKMWDTRGRMKENEIRIWNGKKYIKHNGVVIDYFRFITGAKTGEVVRKYEGDLKIISRSDNQKLNAKIRSQLPTELKQAIKALNKLKKLAYGKENTRS